MTSLPANHRACSVDLAAAAAPASSNLTNTNPWLCLSTERCVTVPCLEHSARTSSPMSTHHVSVPASSPSVARLESNMFLSVRHRVGVSGPDAFVDVPVGTPLPCSVGTAAAATGAP